MHACPGTPITRLVPVSLTWDLPNVAVVPASMCRRRRWRNSSPGRRRGRTASSIGSPGVGTTPHLSGALFATRRLQGGARAVPRRRGRPSRRCWRATSIRHRQPRLLHRAYRIGRDAGPGGHLGRALADAAERADHGGGRRARISSSPPGRPSWCRRHAARDHRQALGGDPRDPPSQCSSTASRRRVRARSAPRPRRSRGSPSRAAHVAGDGAGLGREARLKCSPARTFRLKCSTSA